MITDLASVADRRSYVAERVASARRTIHRRVGPRAEDRSASAAPRTPVDLATAALDLATSVRAVGRARPGAMLLADAARMPREVRDPIFRRVEKLDQYERAFTVLGTRDEQRRCDALIRVVEWAKPQEIDATHAMMRAAVLRFEHPGTIARAVAALAKRLPPGAEHETHERLCTIFKERLNRCFESGVGTDDPHVVPAMRALLASAPEANRSRVHEQMRDLIILLQPEEARDATVLLARTFSEDDFVAAHEQLCDAVEQAIVGDYAYEVAAPDCANQSICVLASCIPERHPEADAARARLLDLVRANYVQYSQPDDHWAHVGLIGRLVRNLPTRLESPSYAHLVRQVGVWLDRPDVPRAAQNSACSLLAANIPEHPDVETFDALLHRIDALDDEHALALGVAHLGGHLPQADPATRLAACLTVTERIADPNLRSLTRRTLAEGVSHYSYLAALAALL